MLAGVHSVERFWAALDSWRTRPWVSTGAGLAVAAIVVIGWWLGRPSLARPVEDGIPYVSTVADDPTDGPHTGRDLADPPSTEPAVLVVHVAGAVQRPGIVSLESGDRVVDAVEAAGGARPEADLNQLNLAALVVDGQQIRVPVEGEVLAAPLVSPPIGAPGSTAAGPTNVNQATASELEELPGIGPSLAAAIVSWREEHGRFSAIDDLTEVPGIGPAKVAQLADHVSV